MRTVLISAIAVYLFFYEYLPPFKRVHFIADMVGYHYPLLNYGFQRLREGRLPEWDPTIYCGLSYVGNIQAALFYPLNWLVFYVNKHRTGLRFYTIEALEIVHYWIAFVLAWRWLRRHTQGELPALLGASSFALTGYLIAESQHLGVVCGAAWYPLGFAAIDDAADRKDWRCLWRLALALALCLLAGYPATWVAFSYAAIWYAIARQGLKGLVHGLAAILAACLLSMVQLAPTLEVASLKSPEATYGAGLPGGWFFYTGYFTPNYYDQSGKTARYGEGHEQYNYLGAAAPIALAALIWRRPWRRLFPAAVVLVATLWLITDPGKMLVRIIPKLPLLGEACREWNFMAVLSVMAALVVAIGLDEFLKHHRWRVAWWLPAGLIAAWSARQGLIWLHGGDFASGWATLAEALIHSLLLGLALCVSRPRLRFVLALVAVFVELKVYGTSRRFNSDPGSVDLDLAKDRRTGGREMTGVDNLVYAELMRNTHYRVLFPDASPATDLRHYGLRSPQGFDPFLPRHYIEAVGEGWVSNRLFRVAVDNTRFHDDFAVRYIFTVNGSQEAGALGRDPRFRRLEPSESFFQVYEYRNAKPVWRFEPGKVECLGWEPERRLFQVQSAQGGPFLLLEQNLPGWRASVDGVDVPVRRVRHAFQQIEVPAGEHRVEFRYRSPGLRFGAGISLVSLLGLLAVARAGSCWRRRTQGPQRPST
ncbi:MAG: YfhO family protein [Bryobacteraceae bacterium]|nr:YfhO family protein [Bryobacteraceae bacterium]MDW8378041.1 YfhO family protein [Bryobacterales bacterium]